MNNVQNFLAFRAVHIGPNRFMGAIGEQEFGVENMSLSHCKKYLASCGYYDEHINFWNVTDVFREKVRKTLFISFTFS